MVKKILSFDGGGVRGLIPALAVEELEKHYAELGSYFDLISGTSTGAILAAAVSEGVTGKVLAAWYKDLTPLIFKRSLGSRLKSLGGVLGPKYDQEKLRSELRQVFGTTKLGEVGVPLLITAYNMTEGKPRFFSSLKDPELNLVEVLLASAAAPTYYDPVCIGGKKYIDGGVFASNPTLSAYAEIKAMHERLLGKDIKIISLGTGDRQQPHTGVEKWSLVQWVKPLIDLMMSSSGSVVDYQLGKIFTSLGEEGNYVRVNAPLFPHLQVRDMADASPKHLEDLSIYASAVYNPILRERGQDIARILTRE
jgi:patatin-like phospholipase/acyl hydrolase